MISSLQTYVQCQDGWSSRQTSKAAANYVGDQRIKKSRVHEAGLSLKGGTGNRGIGESGNGGMGEWGNRGLSHIPPFKHL